MEIIIIEDDDECAEDILKFIKTHFNNAVRVFNDGAQAAEFLLFPTHDQPTLVLLDLTIPSIDALELFRMIKSEPAEREILVMFLVSSLRSKEYIESLGLHPDGYLKKAKGSSPPCRI